LVKLKPPVKKPARPITIRTMPAIFAAFMKKLLVGFVVFNSVRVMPGSHAPNRRQPAPLL
jgi:hypothetical protein